MISTLTRERRKIERNLSGIRHMNRLPEALLVVDPHREHIAVAEARKLGIKVVALLDTDCDPDMVDLPIPGNDDSMRSIELVLNRLTEAIIEGKAAAPARAPAARRSRAGPGPGRPGSRGDRRGGGGGGGAARRTAAGAGVSRPRPATRRRRRPAGPRRGRPRRESRRARGRADCRPAGAVETDIPGRSGESDVPSASAE